MSGGLIEEIGARLVLSGRREFLAATAEAEKAIRSVGTVTKATNAEIAASNRAAADATRLAAAKMTESAALRKAAAEKSVEAARLQANGDMEAAKAANAEAAALKRSAIAAREEATAARAAASAADLQASATRRATVATDAQAASTSRLAGLAKVGKAALLGVAAGSAILGVASVHAAANFQSSMTLVQTMAGVASNRISALSQGLLAMAPGVAAGPNALADALYRIASANAGMGATNKQLLDMTKAAAQLNLIGGGNDASLGETSRVLGGVKASQIAGVGGYKNIVSLAAATVGSGDMKMPDFINALGTGVLPAAKNYGVTLPDVGALLSVLTDNLIPGSTAGHVMAHMFSLMGSPSGVGTKAFNAIGLNATDLNYTMRNKGLIPAMEQLKTRLGAPQTGAAMGGAGAIGKRNAEVQQLAKFGFTDAQIKQIMTKGADSAEQATLLTRMFGGAKQSVPVITALSELDRLKKRQAQIAKQTSPENSSKALDAATSTFNNQLKSLAASVKVLEIRIGSKLIPILEKMASWLVKHKTAAEALGIAIGSVLTVAVVAYTIAMTQAAIATVAATWPIIAIIAVVALLAGGLFYLYQKSMTARIMIRAFGAAIVEVLAVAFDVATASLRLFLWALGHVPGFKWAKTAANDIGKISAKLHGVASDLMHLNGKSATVSVHAKLTGSAAAQALLTPTGVSSFRGAATVAAQPSGLSGFLTQQAGPRAAPHAARAGGGVVHARVPYWVGERGPERFVPNVSGSIRPAGSDGFAMPTRSTPSVDSAGGGARPSVHIDHFEVSGGNGSPHEIYQAAKQGLADAMARR